MFQSIFALGGCDSDRRGQSVCAAQLVPQLLHLLRLIAYVFSRLARVRRGFVRQPTFAMAPFNAQGETTSDSIKYLLIGEKNAASHQFHG